MNVEHDRRPRREKLRRPHVQVSLDLTSIEEALHVAAIAVHAGADWLEAGTPLILAEGLGAVPALADRVPPLPVVAGPQTTGGGYLGVELIAPAGGSPRLVTGVGPPG